MKYEKISQTTEKANREGYLIVVTLKKSADGTSYQVKASARDKKGNTVKNSTRSKYFAEAQQIESKTRQVIALVNAAIPKAAGHTSRSAVFGLSENNPMVIAFHAVKNSEVNISSKWDAQYQRDRLSYFERHVLPHLQHYSDPDDAQALSAREHIYSIIIEDVRKNGNSKGHEPTMQTTARNHMAEADAIYRAMRREDPRLIFCRSFRIMRDIWQKTGTVPSFFDPVFERLKQNPNPSPIEKMWFGLSCFGGDRQVVCCEWAGYYILPCPPVNSFLRSCGRDFKIILHEMNACLFYQNPFSS